MSFVSINAITSKMKLDVTDVMMLLLLCFAKCFVCFLRYCEVVVFIVRRVLLNFVSLFVIFPLGVPKFGEVVVVFPIGLSTCCEVVVVVVVFLRFC